MNREKMAVCLLVLMAFLQTSLYYPMLPAEVSNHYHITGQADSWASKHDFFSLYWLILALASVFFFSLPALLRALPERYVHLPHRAYWLAPHRREMTFAYIKRHTWWFGVSTIALLVTVFQLAIDANMSPRIALSPLAAVPVVIIYVVFAGIWTYHFVTYFLYIGKKEMVV